MIFKFVPPGLKDVDPKSRLLNQLPVVNVPTEAPVVNVKLGAFILPPPVVPKVYVLVIDASAANPPVPVLVKLVGFTILNTVVPAVVCAKTTLYEPNAIERTPVPVELNIPVVKLPPRVSVPAVNV